MPFALPDDPKALQKARQAACFVIPYPPIWYPNVMLAAVRAVYDRLGRGAVATCDTGRDVIRVSGFTLRFVEARPPRSWWPPFGMRPHPPESTDAVEQIDYIMTWYLLHGDALESYLFWIARGRKPPLGSTDGDDANNGGCWPGPNLIDFPEGVLPRRFASLTAEWLRLRPGRHLVVEAGKFTATAVTVAELERLLALIEQRALQDTQA